MKKIIQALPVLTLVIILGYACNEPSNIGEDLLPDEDFIDVLYTDSLELSTSTILGDTVQTYTATLSQQLRYYLCGRLDDPICGVSSSELITQFGIISKPVLTDPVLDSIVLLLAYAPDGHAGDLEHPQSFDVYRVEQDLFSTNTYQSTDTFGIGERIGGIENFIPRVDENTPVRFPYYDTLSTLQIRDSSITSHLRIPLDLSFGQEVLEFVGDSTFVGLADEFLQFLNGINVRPKDNNNAMLRFNLSSALSEIRLYYHESDTLVTPYRVKEIAFPIRSTSVKATTFDHNFTTGEVQNFLDNTASSPQDFTFIQSMEGLSTRIEFPGLEDFQDIAINQAELIVTVVRDSDLDNFPLPQSLAAFQRDADGNLTAIQDVIDAVEVNASLYGGVQTNVVRNGEKITEYRMFVTTFLQGIIDREHEENAMYLLPFDRGEQAARAVLGGSTHDHYPVKLRLTYTKLRE